MVTPAEAREKLNLVRQKYETVLSLATEQQAMLEKGALEDLPLLLSRKAQAVDEAGKLMAQLREPGDAAVRRVIQEGLVELASLVEEVMLIEDRCSKPFQPIEVKPAQARQVASLYRKNVR